MPGNASLRQSLGTIRAAPFAPLYLVRIFLQLFGGTLPTSSLPQQALQFQKRREKMREKLGCLEHSHPNDTSEIKSLNSLLAYAPDNNTLYPHDT